jgi:hypothetical protein
LLEGRERTQELVTFQEQQEQAPVDPQNPIQSFIIDHFNSQSHIQKNISAFRMTVHKA